MGGDVSAGRGGRVVSPEKMASEVAGRVGEVDGEYGILHGGVFPVSDPRVPGAGDCDVGSAELADS